MDLSYSREKLIEHARLTRDDIQQINQCRRPYNRLGEGLKSGLYAY
jgi:hypothetical protein